METPNIYKTCFLSFLHFRYKMLITDRNNQLTFAYLLHGRNNMVGIILRLLASNELLTCRLELPILGRKEAKIRVTSGKVYGEMEMFCYYDLFYLSYSV